MVVNRFKVTQRCTRKAAGSRRFPGLYHSQVTAYAHKQNGIGRQNFCVVQQILWLKQQIVNDDSIAGTGESGYRSMHTLQYLMALSAEPNVRHRRGACQIRNHVKAACAGRVRGCVQAAQSRRHAVTELIECQVLPGFGCQALDGASQSGFAGAGRAVEQNDGGCQHSRMEAPQAQSVQAIFGRLAEPAIISVLGPVADYRTGLSATEYECVAAAIEKRQREFSSGRQFARVAMSALGLQPASLSAGTDRAPDWPAAMVGSISHSDALAWVVGARRDASGLQSLGVDIEQLNRLGAELNGKLFRPAELARMEQLACVPELPLLESVPRLAAEDRLQRLATLWFSAKEAVYKATAPIAGQFIGFQEVELVPDTDGTEFSMRYHGDHPPSAIMESGRGYLAIKDTHALTLFLIPTG